MYVNTYLCVYVSIVEREYDATWRKYTGLLHTMSNTLHGRSILLPTNHGLLLSIYDSQKAKLGLPSPTVNRLKICGVILLMIM